MKVNKGIGKIAFLVGFLGAIILGLAAGLGVFEAAAWMTIALIIAGVVIGLLNVNSKELVAIMVAALVIGAGTGGLSLLPFIGETLIVVLSSLATVMISVGVVVAVMAFYEKAK